LKQRAQQLVKAIAHQVKRAAQYAQKKIAWAKRKIAKARKNSPVLNKVLSAVEKNPKFKALVKRGLVITTRVRQNLIKHAKRAAKKAIAVASKLDKNAKKNISKVQARLNSALKKHSKKMRIELLQEDLVQVLPETSLEMEEGTWGHWTCNNECQELSQQLKSWKSGEELVEQGLGNGDRAGTGSEVPPVAHWG